MEKAADEGQVLGDAALAAPLQVDAEQFGGRAGDVESARFERRPDLVGVAAGFSRGACAAPLGAMEARSDVGERSAAVEPFHFEQARFEPQPLGADQPSGLRDGNAARFGDDLCCDEQRRGVACEVFVHVESERRASPAPPVIGTGAAVAADPSGVTEPGDVFGCGELGGEVPGGVSERRIHAAKIVVFFGLALRPAASGHEICGTGGKSSYGRQRFY